MHLRIFSSFLLIEMFDLWVKELECWKELLLNHYKVLWGCRTWAGRLDTQLRHFVFVTILPTGQSQVIKMFS